MTELDCLGERGGQTGGGTGYYLLHGEQYKGLKWLHESNMSCSSRLRKQKLLDGLQESRKCGEDGGEKPLSLLPAVDSGTYLLVKCQ